MSFLLQQLKPLLKPLWYKTRAYVQSIEPLHGRIEFPYSRAHHLIGKGLNVHQASELEGGKGFPSMLGHQIDPDAPDDEPSREPPWEYQIASGGHTEDNRKYLDYAYGEPITEPVYDPNLGHEVQIDTHWTRYTVDRNVKFKVAWVYEAAHKTRRWSYWLTQPGWDSSQRLSRTMFGQAPFKVFLNTFTPYWDPRADDELIPPTRHIQEFDLPEREGYHVLLAIWDVADTASAFYQVIDLFFPPREASAQDPGSAADIGVMHGKVTTPESRSAYLARIGKLSQNDANAIDSGKGFPGTGAGYVDPVAPDDVWAAAPPPDGKIASAGHTDGRAALDDPTELWPKHRVNPNSTLDVTWNFSMPHKTRRFTYWLTKQDWDANSPLTRADFDLEKPVHEVINTFTPYSAPGAEEQLVAPNPSHHSFTLPARTGHQVLLAVWNIADTPAAFYQVIDLLFVNAESGE